MRLLDFFKCAIGRKVKKPEKREQEVLQVIPGLNPKFNLLIQQLLAEAEEEGLSVGVFQGYRSYEKQAKLYAKGRTAPGKIVTKAKPGYSWHNFGLAADVVFKTKGGHWSWAEKHDWDHLGQIGKSIGLTWGGDFKSFSDRPHFQLTNGMTTAKARELYKIGGLEAVWEKV